MQGRQFALTVVFLVAEAMFAGTAWSAQAGRVQFVNGDVQVTDAAGKVHAMQKGQPINEGDTVTSAQNASAQIKMLDGGFVAIRPDTRLKFDSFKFSNKEGEPENSFFSLFKGGFRAITGLIGRIRHEEYKITTPAATIGIRGTDHETVVVVPNDPLVAAGQAAPGTYNKVNTGETSITTDVGTINVLPNQMGYAGASDQMPEIQPVNTNLFTVTPPPSPSTTGGNQGGESGERDTAVVDTSAQPAEGGASTTTSVADGSSVQQVTAPPTQVVTPTQSLSSGIMAWPSQAAGAIGLFYTDGTNTLTTGGGGIVQVTPSASGGLGAFSVSFGTCIANCQYNVGFTGGSLGSASLLDQGSNLLAGNLHWGRWFGPMGSATVSGLPTGTNFLGNLVYIGGDVPTMPVTGTATYVPVGGTAPVDVNGNTGTFLGANVLVNFTLLEMTVSNFQVQFGNYLFTMSGTGVFLSNGVIPAIPFSNNSCSGCPTGWTITGDYAGSFTGLNAAGLALGYHIAGLNGGVTGGQTTQPAFEIMGAQGFIRQ